MQTKNSTNKGFTLIEVIIYLGIVSTILLAVATLFTIVVEARMKYEAITEVEQQGIFALKKLAWALRSANSINFPAPGNVGDSLSLSGPDFADDPLIIAATDGIFTETAGLNPAANLTASSVSVSGLSFTRMNDTNTIRIHFTLRSQQIQGRRTLNYEADFYDSVTLRQ